MPFKDKLKQKKYTSKYYSEHREEILLRIKKLEPEREGHLNIKYQDPIGSLHRQVADEPVSELI